MDGEIQQEAVDAAKMAMEISMESVEIAEYIKKRFDKLFMPSEHCIVGPHFIEYSRSQQQEQTFSPEERLEVLSTKMSRNMEQDALDVASRALQRSREPREIAQYIKKEFDEKYEPNWHCIVGNHFGR
ncbi:unnamed protein product [Hymenolepis diminuta]|uniref:Dynein light chain n=1 Tax=Hymenolepis diminuta TaxID=6216 RepID=A0A0R3SJB3_HYMDI|nr:unnamed protein product [Hymenolepis diminuta]